MHRIEFNVVLTVGAADDAKPMTAKDLAIGCQQMIQSVLDPAQIEQLVDKHLKMQVADLQIAVKSTEMDPATAAMHAVLTSLMAAAADSGLLGDMLGQDIDPSVTIVEKRKSVAEKIPEAGDNVFKLNPRGSDSVH
jgi:hypothetical protein